MITLTVNGLMDAGRVRDVVHLEEKMSQHPLRSFEPIGIDRGSSNLPHSIYPLFTSTGKTRLIASIKVKYWEHKKCILQKDHNSNFPDVPY